MLKLSKSFGLHPFSSCISKLMSCKLKYFAMKHFPPRFMFVSGYGGWIENTFYRKQRTPNTFLETFTQEWSKEYILAIYKCLIYWTMFA